MTRLAIACYGLRVGVEIGTGELRDEALLRLPPGWSPTSWDRLDREVVLDRDAGRIAADHGEYRVCVDGVVTGVHASAGAALDAFEDAIQYHVAEFAEPWLFVHAGVVGWRGEATVLPGRSFSGKSTLVHALVEAGAEYLSDEYAVVDAEGRVRPYRRRLSLREGPYGQARRVTHGATGTPAARACALPVTRIALLRYDAEAGWNVMSLSHARMVMGLCDNTVAIQRRPADALALLSKVAEGADGIEGTRGDIEEAVGHLLR